MPFLVDSVAMELNALNLTVHLVIHPIFEVERDKAGRLVKVAEGHESGNGAARESFMQTTPNNQPKTKVTVNASGTDADTSVNTRWTSTVPVL